MEMERKLLQDFDRTKVEDDFQKSCNLIRNSRIQLKSIILYCKIHI